MLDYIPHQNGHSRNSETVWIVMGMPLYFQTKILDSKRLWPKVCKWFDTLSKQMWKLYPTKNWTISEPSTSSFTSQRNPMFHEVSPPISSSEATAISVLCIHGRLRLEEPLGYGIVASVGCQEQRCPASEATARGQATGSTQTKGTKNFGASKVKVFEIVATQFFSLNLRNMTCRENIELVEKTVAFGVLSKPCQPYLHSRCAWINPN